MTTPARHRHEHRFHTASADTTPKAPAAREMRPLAPAATGALG